MSFFQEYQVKKQTHMILKMVHANLNSFLAGGQLGTHVKPISSYLGKEIIMDGMGMLGRVGKSKIMVHSYFEFF